MIPVQKSVDVSFGPERLGRFLRRHSVRETEYQKYKSVRQIVFSKHRPAHLRSGLRLSTPFFLL